MINKGLDSISSEKWKNSNRTDYSTLHQIAPYIGKMKPTMAKELVTKFSIGGDLIFDPFTGSGTVALEALIEGRSIICNDINPYAYTLTMAKLFPPSSLEEATKKAKYYLGLISSNKYDKEVPNWVQDFFHPKTLKETVIFSEILKKHNEHFLLACLLGILHHQRPGFLSYPASNLVPYLKTNKYPKDKYPDMYEYRDIESRFLSKLKRVYKRFPKIDFELRKECHLISSTKMEKVDVKFDAVITSPPYMNNLDYARDNRLRLWFLDKTEHKHLDESIRNEDLFTALMTKTFEVISTKLRKDGYAVLVLGNKNKNNKIIDIVESIVSEVVGGYKLQGKIDDQIPDIRRTRKNNRGTKKEWILVFKKK